MTGETWGTYARVVDGAGVDLGDGHDVCVCTGLISRESIAEAEVELRGSRVYIGALQPCEYKTTVYPPAGAEVDPEETHHRRPALGCKRPAEPQTGMGEWWPSGMTRPAADGRLQVRRA